MPRFTYTVTPAGLAVPVLVGLDGRTTAALHAAGLAIPLPVHARGLLDTGADVTAAASWVLQKLTLSPTNTAKTYTAAGPAFVRLFEVSLSIVDPAVSGQLLLTEPDLLVTELVDVLPDADVLIGLDLLLSGKLLLDGSMRQFTLDF